MTERKDDPLTEILHDVLVELLREGEHGNKTTGNPIVEKMKEDGLTIKIGELKNIENILNKVSELLVKYKLVSDVKLDYEQDNDTMIECVFTDCWFLPIEKSLREIMKGSWTNIPVICPPRQALQSLVEDIFDTESAVRSREITGNQCKFSIAVLYKYKFKYEEETIDKLTW